MNETEIAEAIAQQEEYLERFRNRWETVFATSTTEGLHTAGLVKVVIEGLTNIDPRHPATQRLGAVFVYDPASPSADLDFKRGMEKACRLLEQKGMA